MAACRIYLCTYRRNKLLPRALDSLISQTVTDWVCELHNDDPEDSFPKWLVEQTNDPRILIVDHEKNLGATRTFNLVFQEVPEPFVSLLEDDNWWEPNFLEEMLEAMKRFPEAKVAWANMRVWQETRDGKWVDTKGNTWNSVKSTLPELVYWPNKRQMTGALHSNGAMLIRSKYAGQYKIPENMKFGGTEAVRERSFHFPILFVPKVLANFSVTVATSRPNSHIDFGFKQVLLTASYIKNVHIENKALSDVWRDAWNKPAKSTATLFLAALRFSECRKLLKCARLQDWLFFVAFLIKSPLRILLIWKSISQNQELWEFMDTSTMRRTKESKQYSHIVQSI